MKTKLKTLLVVFCFIMMQWNIGLAQQGVAINTTNAAPDNSAMLDVSSTAKGVLLPRLTEAQKNLIALPANGLLIYQTDGIKPGFYYNAGTGTPNWMFLGSDNLGNHTATQLLDMDSNKIVNLALCTQNLDAANKEYVDNKVASGGGGISSPPAMISNESAVAYTHAQAIRYCDSLTEGGHTDWKLPALEEMIYFEGISTASTNFLWTRTYSNLLDLPTNQNFSTMRLTDGKWTDGGIQEFFFPQRYVTGYSNSTSWTTAASFLPLIPGNLFILSSLTFYSYAPCSNQGNFRLKYNLADGTSFYSPTVFKDCSSGNDINQTSIAPLSDKAAYSSIDVEIQSMGGSSNKTATLYISGYEISLKQGDGTTLYCRCVR